MSRRYVERIQKQQPDIQNRREIDKGPCPVGLLNSWIFSDCVDESSFQQYSLRASIIGDGKPLESDVGERERENMRKKQADVSRDAG